MKIIQINGSIIGLAAITFDSQTIIDKLERKELYLPFIEKIPEHRRREWLLVRLLVKEMTGEEKEILYCKSGKPYIADGSYYISISHTKGYVTVILNSEHEAAIDIEKISPRVLNVAQRFMNEEEMANVPSNCEIIYLLLHWSAKESVFKIMNESGVDFKEHIKITPFNPVCGEWGTFAATETKTVLTKNFTVHYLVTENVVLTAIV